MTVLELVDRERDGCGECTCSSGLAMAIAATCPLVARGASILGSARWIALPRPVPFLIWALVLAADVGVVVWTARRLERRTTRGSVAAAIEREQSMRAGALRGVLEVANSGALGRRAADAVSSKLEPVRTWACAGRNSALSGAARPRPRALQPSAMAALAFAVPNYNDGLLAIMLARCRAWQGTLLPRITFTNLPPAVLRGETARLQIAAARRGSDHAVAARTR